MRRITLTPLIKFEVVDPSSSVIYGKLKLRVPACLLVDRENTIQAIFEPESGCWPGSGVIFYISIKYVTLYEFRTSTLTTISFSTECRVSVVQVKDFSVLIPRELYRQLADNVVEINVANYDVYKPLLVSVYGKSIIENIGVSSYILKYAP